MKYRSSVIDILHREGIDEPLLLGSGEDAVAFALSDDEAIRVFPEMSLSYVSELVALYARLRRNHFSFQCPCIHDVRTHNGVPYTVETRLPGRPTEACRGVDVDGRRRILRNYVNAVRELAAVEADDVDFGGLIPSTVWLIARTWEEFLRCQLSASLHRVGSRLSTEIPDFQQTVGRLESLFEGPMRWERKSLVHGDAFPHNILIGEHGEVATILDFGRDTLVGDPRLDVAIAIELTEIAGFTPEDTAYLRQQLPGKPAEVNAYRAYTAILLAARHCDFARLVERCVNSLRATIGTF